MDVYTLRNLSIKVGISTPNGVALKGGPNTPFSIHPKKWLLVHQIVLFQRGDDVFLLPNRWTLLALNGGHLILRFHLKDYGMSTPFAETAFSYPNNDALKISRI